jgi:hypothetical protein
MGVTADSGHLLVVDWEEGAIGTDGYLAPELGSGFQRRIKTCRKLRSNRISHITRSFEEKGCIENVIFVIYTTIDL